MMLSLMLGLVEAMRQAERSNRERPSVRWAMRTPVDSPLSRPERCWFWGASPLAS